MRIRRLAFAGLGPFRAEQCVDFDRLEDVGVYLIAGRTGAGKSTILDAIAFALYGSVPRFDGTASRLRSDHSGPEDETFAELEFEAAGRVYRVRRSPEYARPKRRGSGTTTQPAKVELLEQIDGSWVGLSSSAKEVARDIGGIVGLTKDQFLQVILLAQNRFHEFLLAKNDDRQRLLRTLFATERFDLLRRRLLEQRDASEVGLEEERAAVTALADEASRLVDDGAEPPAPDAAWFAGLPARLAAPLDAARSDAAAADAVQAAASTALDEVRRIARGQERRRLALIEAEELSVAEAHVERQRAAIERARRSDGVLPLLRSARAADEKERAALRQRELAAEAYGDFATGPAAETAERLAAALGALAEALADERRLPEADRAAEQSARAERAAASALAGLEEELNELPARVDALTAEEESLAGEAAAVAVRTDEFAALERRIAAVSERDLAAADLRLLQTAYAEAARAHGERAAKQADLVARRFAGFAGELAERLTPGAPCPVCGSREHPRPAEHDGPTTVGTADLDRARRAVESAAAVLDSAREREGSAALALAALDERVGDATELEPLRAALEERLISARAAAARAEGLRRERIELRARIDALTASRDAARAEHQALEGAAASAAESSRLLRARVEASRDGAVSVTARAEDLSLQRRRALALVEAEEAARTRTETAVSVRAELAEVLLDRGFASAGEAESAALASGDRVRAEAAVAEHERRRHTTEATLAEPELRALPDTPADVSAAEEHSRDASARRDEARARLSVLEHRSSRLAELAAGAAGRLGALEERLRRHEELRALAETVSGRGQNTRRMDLEAFALAGRLEEIIAAANLRLDAMTSGRYALAHDDSLAYRGAASGLGIDVLDAFTGVRRQPASLSGGETFLASLALALGLADVVTAQSGGISLETMFIDEGFGSLDAETLETALGTLDALRSGGRTIGLISHVDAMRERLPIALHVVVGPRGDSTILTG
ncbi:ATPase [Rathayibacter rathayi]|uniref:AAA family ATPase n=1 Tax=Rathayibacter rathayi TaxID=33887 RepID=UPI000CE88A7C|nr:AAA family ATPase [Rathayibacter rathayi]PPF51849.1 ATPase [Rathayibacter rathayi]PPG90350.1 ATPase [Rathayibacter rathayi]PPG99130.1 ATPase [Rathayibacter rathayi]PPH39402.1 ATPase [Rathayibacter rathayi]PPH70424.1 ATPase [Rathayibacter rathayi]